MPRDRAQTRAHIVDAAYRLFYRQGFLRSGVEAVAAAAGVTKRTLYNHFTSKDDLIAAVLADHAAVAEAEMATWTDPASSDPERLIQKLFDNLRRWTSRRDWQGSGFTRAAMELAWARGHPARRVASAHKSEVESLLAEALETAGVVRPDAMARETMLLIEGAIALRLIHGDPGYIDAAEVAALRLVRPRRIG